MRLSSALFKPAPIALIALLALGPAVRSSRAVTVTGTDWLVHFNLPDQNSSIASASADEYAIRNALVARINDLQSGNWALLTTYTFSGSNTTSGAAGSIINAIEGALNRGAQVRFAVDYDVVLTDQNGGTNSLFSLAARPVNPLILVQATNAAGIMHDKVGVFDYGPTNRWVFIASWNLTGGASIFQWNIAMEARNQELYVAYSNEVAELLAGHFHYDPAKSHAHDRSTFFLPGSWTNGTARFAPFPSSAIGGNNAQTDITNFIAGAQQEIVFALNKLTRTLIATSLVQAANRGVLINGVIPRSDTDPGGESTNIYSFLTNSANYAGSNHVHLATAYAKADYSAVDSGQSDLVHAKFMVIDPFGARPLVIHGSANWTDSALASTSANDENLVYVPNGEIARAFYACFKRITGLFTNRDDFWMNTRPLSNGTEVALWTTDGTKYMIDRTTNLLADWTAWSPTISNITGRAVFTNNGAGPAGFFRAHRIN